MDIRRSSFIASAVMAGLLPIVGNGLYDGGDSSGTAVLQRARDGLPTIAYIAYPLELAGFAALTVLLACLTVMVFRRAPVAAATTAIAGAGMVAVKVGSVAPLMALQVSHDGVDPATAELVTGINGASFVISGFLLCLALTAAGLGLLHTDEPRWLSWWATGAGSLGMVAGTIGILAPQAYVPVPFLLLLLWMIAYGLTAALGANRGITIPSGGPVTE